MLKRSTKLKIGDAKDDIHVCIKCLQALMNNKFGFNMVIVHEKAINSVALSLVSNIFPILWIYLYENYIWLIILVVKTFGEQLTLQVKKI